jgi:hypothetical protein
VAQEESKQVRPFVAGEHPGASRLNEVVGPLNQVVQQFGESRKPFSSTPIANMLRVKIVGSLDNAGYYKCKIIHEPGKPLTTDEDLAEDHIGTPYDNSDNDTYDAIGRHLGEIGGGTPLPEQSYYLASVYSNDEHGRVIVDISPGGAGSREEEKVLGSNVEGSESASADTWDQDDDAKGLGWWIVSRIGYFHAGDKKLYAYMRKAQWDSAGNLFHVSAETRIEIDAAETCT